VLPTGIDRLVMQLKDHYALLMETAQRDSQRDRIDLSTFSLPSQCQS
jgi:hypothetical protein